MRRSRSMPTFNGFRSLPMMVKDLREAPGQLGDAVPGVYLSPTSFDSKNGVGTAT